MACKEPSSTKGPVYLDQPIPRKVPVYRIAVHPLHNSDELLKVYAPLAKYLESQVPGIRFEVESSLDYSAFEAKLRAKGPEFILPNPLQTLWAIDSFGYHVLCMAGAASDFKGVILVRNTSKIRHPLDLKGRVVSYPSRTALAACILPQKLFHDSGLNLLKDLDNHYVGSQESSIQSVVKGFSDAGCTWPQAWRVFQKEHPLEASQIHVQWETPTFVNNSFMVRKEVPKEVAEKVQLALRSMQSDSATNSFFEGSQIQGFYAATDTTYERVRNYVTEFEKHVKKIRD